MLYLHDNAIRKIENFLHLSALTHLCLQRNRIKKIDQLNGLLQLKKLYLGSNEISVLENVDQLPMLEELHLERQRQASDQEDVGEWTFTFDSKSLEAIAVCNSIIFLFILVLVFFNVIRTCL